MFRPKSIAIAIAAWLAAGKPPMRAAPASAAIAPSPRPSTLAVPQE
jgi:hypothetical protein